MISPVKPGRTLSTSAAETSIGFSDVTSPSASKVSVATPNRAAATYSLGRAVTNRNRRVARPKPNVNRPVAIGSKVPAWPIFFIPKIRRAAATAPCEDIPAGLSTTVNPVHAAAPGTPPRP